MAMSPEFHKNAVSAERRHSQCCEGSQIDRDIGCMMGVVGRDRR
jgi:hypothetical protein